MYHKLIMVFSNFKEQRYPWGGDRRSTGQQIPRLAWICAHNTITFKFIVFRTCLWLDPILRNINPVHNIHYRIHIRIAIISMTMSSSYVFLGKISYVFFIFPVHATWPSNIIPFNFMKLTIFIEYYKAPYYGVFSMLQRIHLSCPLG